MPFGTRLPTIWTKSRQLSAVPAGTARSVIIDRYPSCSLTCWPTIKGDGPLNPANFDAYARSVGYSRLAARDDRQQDMGSPHAIVIHGLRGVSQLGFLRYG